MKITITEADEKEFSPSSNLKKNNFQSSILGANNPTGALRWHGVSNGRYERHHPVSDASNSVVGYLVGGVNEIGYTYCCLYSDKSRRFFVSHVPFGMVWGNSDGEKKSFISVIEEVGKFLLFRKGTKFKRTTSFDFQSKWVGSEAIYRFINDDRQLICVSGFGFCLVDVFSLALDVKILFGNEYEHTMTGAALSPNEKILAVTMCEWEFTDPVKDEEVYKNTLGLFDLKSGRMIGGLDLEFKGFVSTSKVSFSSCGSHVSLFIGDKKLFFKLDASCNK